MPKRPQTVWVIMHYEIMGLSESYWIDCLQFHVSSSLKKAEASIRRVQVDAHSWWQVHPHEIDTTDFDEGVETHFDSHRGTRLKSAPATRAIAAFRKHVARNPEIYGDHPEDRR